MKNSTIDIISKCESDEARNIKFINRLMGKGIHFHNVEDSNENTKYVGESPYFIKIGRGMYTREMI